MNTRKAQPIVLVVDDNDIDRAAMESLLSAAGFEVHSLPTPIGVTRTARQLGIQVLVIDQNLPAMDGSKVAALFRGNSAMRHVRVVLVSGNDGEEMLALARKAEVDAFVSKADIHHDLVTTVRRMLPSS